MRYNMKKLFVLVPIAAILAACGSTNVYDKRADNERERRERAVERSIDKAPKWMSKLPESQNAVYANGSAVSRDFAMADMKAKNIALSSICMAAGGEVDKSSKIYMNDTESASAENSEVAIRSMCRKVDVSGAEVVETVRVAENGRFRSYMLIALPTGDANAIVKRRDQVRASKNAVIKSDTAFDELSKP
jgi:hypothetical protein